MRMATNLPTLLVAMAAVVAMVWADERLIGWMGEQKRTGGGRTLDAQEDTSTWRGEVVRLSWKPRAFLYKKLLTEEECDHLKKLGSPTLQASTVVDSKTGGSVPSSVRTSYGTFLQKAQDEVVARIEKRIADVSMIPVENGESLQILRYEVGQKYEAHFDYFHDNKNARPENGGQRIATVLMYIEAPEEGGETLFPDAEIKPNYQPHERSECGSKGLSVRPQKGDALLFYSLTTEGKEDPRSLHASCPVIRGNKWSATKWMHVGAFRPGVSSPSTGCRDSNERCEEWAMMDECKKNPAYMLEYCKMSCEVCKS